MEQSSELINVVLPQSLNPTRSMKQSRLLNDKENHPIVRQSTASNRLFGNNQSTPLNPKSKCKLSPALLSRISFNDRCDETPQRSKTSLSEHIIETPQRASSMTQDEKLNTLKKTPSASAHGMRVVKSLSDTITLQKKIIVGSDRLKRLTLSRSLFNRQTSLISKKLTNISNTFFNSLAKIRKKNDPIEERRKIQVLNVNNSIQRATNVGEESKVTVQRVSTLTNKQFKLGAPTTFLTRSLASHGSLE